MTVMFRNAISLIAICVNWCECALPQSPSPEITCRAPEVGLAEIAGRIEFTPVSCPLNLTKECSEEPQKYRTADGTCNHPSNFGSANTPFRRWLPPAYDDHTNAPVTRGNSGSPLPSASEVSRLIHEDFDLHNNRTTMFMQFGQFIDHDITFTPMTTETLEPFRCCGPNGEVPARTLHEECFPIILSSNDIRFQGKCMEFGRSVAARTPTGIRLSPREQINAATSFIDGSMIYGNNEHHQIELRESGPSGPGALLKTSAGDLLPPVLEGKGPCIHREGDFCFLAGDDRVNEQPALAVIHTIFVRFHNIVALKLRLVRPSDSEEDIFQMARKIVVAILQNIHYYEWLPLVIGQANMHLYKLSTNQRVDYSPDTDPRIRNGFATAAFRFGHSMIPRHYNISGRLHPLRNLFARPDMVFDDFNGVLTSMVSSVPTLQAQKVNRFLVSEVTGHLFEPVDQQHNTPSRGFDLAALNIQRGRDHGLPPYNQYRKWCGLEPISNFIQFGENLGRKLAFLYGDMNDVDLFTGGLLETPVSDSIVGPLFACMIAEQFFDLKFGDKFFFETNLQPQAFTDEQLEAIRNVTIAHVCCLSSNFTSVQMKAFLATSSSNPQISCTELRRNFLNFDLWAE